MTESQTREALAEKFGVLSDRLLVVSQASGDLDAIRQELHLLYSEVKGAIQAQSSQTVRLRELAKQQALNIHAYCLSMPTNLATSSAEQRFIQRGHEGEFESCPHPDCVLIREAERERQE